MLAVNIPEIFIKGTDSYLEMAQKVGNRVPFALLILILMLIVAKYSRLDGLLIAIIGTIIIFIRTKIFEGMQIPWLQPIKLFWGECLWNIVCCIVKSCIGLAENMIH